MVSKRESREKSPTPGGRSLGSTDETNAEPPSPKRRKLQSNKNDSNSRTPGTRRKTACQSCRLRKVKCDAVRPVCGICKASESACKYTDPLPEKLSLDSATELLSSKLDQLQSGIDKLHKLAQSNAHQGSNGVAAEHSGREGDPDLPRQAGGIYIAEPSKDFLQIPAHSTTADTVLNWEVYEGKYPPMLLIGVLFTPSDNELAHDRTTGGEYLTVTNGLMPLNEEQIPYLVDKFLENVHTKNPVLDVEQLVKQSRVIASNGLGWDAWSCLVLLAAALGTVAKPFDASVTTTVTLDGRTDVTWTHDGPTTPKELQQAESYFALASRRLGSLRHSILGAQCYFFAGVYLMYTMRPLLSWQYFTQSSNLYQLYMKTSHGLAADISQLGQLPIEHAAISDSKRRRLEESMYWSCFKSESEFRVELPLPQSEIANYYHPQMFPSPPSPPGLHRDDSNSIQEFDDPLPDNAGFGHMRSSFGTAPYSAEELELREHAKKLCNEEESWYYYLTEIALRRIGNRIINTFFRQSHGAWLDVRPLLHIALEFDTQVSAWSAHLPAAMQHWETNYTIRAPTLESWGTGNHVSRELSWATDNRLLEMRSWLYQPFLYFFIHNVPTIRPVLANNRDSSGMPTRLPSQEAFLSTVFQATPSLGTEDASALYHFIISGIELNLKILDVRSLRHRHHGLWYDMRSLMTASLIVLAIIKAGHDMWLPGGVETLWGFRSQALLHEQPIGGKLGHVIAEFDFWSDESPDLKHHREVLEDVIRMVQQIWVDRKRA